MLYLTLSFIPQSNFLYLSPILIFSSIFMFQSSFKPAQSSSLSPIFIFYPNFYSSAQFSFRFSIFIPQLSFHSSADSIPDFHFTLTKIEKKSFISTVEWVKEQLDTLFLKEWLVQELQEARKWKNGVKILKETLKSLIQQKRNKSSKVTKLGQKRVLLLLSWKRGMTMYMINKNRWRERITEPDKQRAVNSKL